MVLWASALSLAASSAGLVMLGSNPILGELSALGFAVSLFIIICAERGLARLGASVHLRRLQLHPGLVAVSELDTEPLQGVSNEGGLVHGDRGLALDALGPPHDS